MALVVAKFGGSSVATVEKIRNVANRLVRRHREGDKVVVVVSAMGDSTDDLLSMANALNRKPPQRELDMLLSTGEQVSMSLLAMAINALGVPAVSHTAGQVGIITDLVHTKAKIAEVKADRIKEDLDSGNIVIVAGFQGISQTGEITTLGRGGSDTTAVALAAALKANFCEIYSDVDGVYTADPRICPKAHRIPEISYEEMLELSSCGAGVLHMRSVEYARRHGVVIHARCSFNNNPGTLVKEARDIMEAAIISGVAHDLSEAKITLHHLPDSAGIAAMVFESMAKLNVNLDMIIQDVSHDGRTDISFTLPKTDLEIAIPACEKIIEETGAEGVLIKEDIAKVSLVGAGMKTAPGITAKMFRTMADAGVNISMISTSPIRISTVIDANLVETAVQSLHSAFGLDADSVIDEWVKE